MKMLLLISVCTAAGVILGGCATVKKSLPKQIPDAITAACDVYTKAKPQVIAAREYAKAHWNDKVPGTDQDLIPADVKKVLLDLDAYLPQIDRAGLAICAAAEGLDALQQHENESGSIDWNVVLTDVLKAASIAL